MLEQIARNQYEIKALTNDQVKFQPKTSEFYGTAVKSLAERRIK
jgi:hypothetical protein